MEMTDDFRARRFTEVFINTDEFAVLARRRAFPAEPISKTAQALRLTRQTVYRALKNIRAAGFELLIPLALISAYDRLEY